MAFSPFPVEDQTDGQFFDKLVEGEDEDNGSGVSSVENVESDDAQSFAELRVGKVGPVGDGLDSKSIAEGAPEEKGILEYAVSCSLDGYAQSMRANESGTSESSKSDDSKSIVESGDQATGAVGEFNLKACGNSLNVGTGVKEVQWSAFNSDFLFNGGTGDRSYSEFFDGIGEVANVPFAEVIDSTVVESSNTAGVSSNIADNSSSYRYVQHDETYQKGLSAENTTEMQIPNSSQYWENLYPGWRYDLDTGQWHQLVSSDVIADTEGTYNGSMDSTIERVISKHQSDAYYSQQTAYSVIRGVTEGCTTGNMSYWNQNSMGTVEYPAHVLFDAQYPGWYYDTTAQEWRLLESFTAPGHKLASSDPGQQAPDGSVSKGTCYSEQSYTGRGQCDQVDNYHKHQDRFGKWNDSTNSSHEQNMNQWQPGPLAENEAIRFTGSMQSGNANAPSAHLNDSTDSKEAFVASGTASWYQQLGQGVENNIGLSGFQSFSPAENVLHHHKQHNLDMSHQIEFSDSHLNGPKLLNMSQLPLQNGSPFSCAPSGRRSSDGRPMHALVSFGFGGKLIVMKDHSSFLSTSSHDSAEGVIKVLNLMEVVMPPSDGSNLGLGSRSYFHTLFQQFPGPLVSGNVGSKELNTWIDHEVAKSATLDGDYRRAKVLEMLLSLLKVACGYYGKLRSPIGTDHVLKESDCPESALAKLFATAKRNDTQFTEPSSCTWCLKNLPSEGQIQATALEVQKLLVSGRRIEALQCAQEGQLWGPAIVIAAQLGDQFYGDTVKQMALYQLIEGCPLRTLCLLIAGRPADVFSNYTTGITQSIASDVSQPAQIGANHVLDEWEENLAIITSNRTKGDELVITHLGDCLWKENGEVAAAHICYLVAEATIEPYSDSARLCLIGADHWKYPRTYARPDAIQRTEVYEHAKVLGNSQFILLPFQPYKLIYAYMLAEVGKLSDSLKYCQAILKSLKTVRAPEVEAWKQLVLSLEDRIKMHQQGGYAANLAPAKLVGKLLNLFDSTAHRVVGGLPPSAPSISHSNGQHSEHDHQLRGARVSTSQSTMAMSSLVPSESCEPINEWIGVGSRKSLHNRSISEPDISRIPKKVDSTGTSHSSDYQYSTSVSGGSSRFGRFGSQLFQKTIGLVLRPHPERQAKLGERNKFYYDENLKRWIEEGAERPAEEPALAPPPTAATFTSGIQDQIVNDGSRNDSLLDNGELDFKSPNYTEKSLGIPPIPPSSNQFSTRGRIGVRARYVDTFNKGGAIPGNLFQSLSAPPAAKAAGGSAKFFIPAPLPSQDYTSQAADTTQETVAGGENLIVAGKGNSSSPPQLPTSAPIIMQRNPSMDNMVNGRRSMISNGDGSIPPRSRRTASWSEGISLGVSADFANVAEMKSFEAALHFPMPTAEHSATQLLENNITGRDDLQEVEL
ncbi:hypothetical protein Nepgr_023504 [Nepenthes gracilis]|uniref:Protein transport protein sec16 n=1 Tax=Nepenthes gracilis TaxID=150966 RepID=A0AAD3T416_NEPGR|nr:hypothetical protein Nepgr_023504 [Nepenthes gracilis]